MPVADPAVSEVDIAGKAPVVQDNVRQAVIAVKQGISLQQRQAFLCGAFCVFKGRKLPKALKEIRLVMRPVKPFYTVSV